jgi:hypothetical protein
LKPFGGRGEVLPEVFQGNVEFRWIELNPHQEEVGVFIGMLVGMEDVPIVAVNEVRHRSHNAFLVRTADQQDGGIFHGKLVIW